MHDTNEMTPAAWAWVGVIIAAAFFTICAFIALFGSVFA